MTLIFQDGFESGGTAAWDASTGSPTVAASATLIGSYLLQVPATGKVVQDNYTNATAHNARFYFKPNALSFTGTTSSLRMLNVRTGTTAVGRVLLGFNGTNYTVAASILNDSGSFQSTSGYTVTDARHYCEVHYAFGTAGTVALYIDGALQESITGVDCDTRSADNDLLGWTNTGGTVAGTLLLDAFRSDTSDYIGPESFTISPSAITSAEAFGTATISYGASTITPTAISSAEAFGTPSVTFNAPAGTLTISPSAIASAEAFGSATVTFEGTAAATDFDEGLHVIPFCWMDGGDGETIWQEMSRAAQSEGGYIWFDRTGMLVFKNREAFATDACHTTSQHTFTVSRLADIRIGESSAFDNVFNQFKVSYSPRYEAGLQTIYSIEKAISLLPGQSETFTAKLNYPCTSVTIPVKKTDYLAVTPTGANINTSLGITYTKYGQHIDVVLTNNHAYHLMIIQKFQFRGIPLIGTDSAEVKLNATDSAIGDPTSGNPLYLKEKSISSNLYIQTKEQATALCTELRDRLKRPRATFRLSNVPMIPWLEIGDRVTLVEAGSGINLDCFITEIQGAFNKGVFKGDYVLIECAAWYPYTDYFILGTDTIGSSKRVYY